MRHAQFSWSKKEGSPVILLPPCQLKAKLKLGDFAAVPLITGS